jgi:hypothetical protein
MGQLMVLQQRVNPIFPVPVYPRNAEGRRSAEIARWGAVVKRAGMEAQ